MIGPMHHSSRTVSDIERSIAFYRDTLGFEVVEDISSDEEGIQYASTTPESKLRIVMLQAGGAVVELIQFLKQEGKALRQPAGAERRGQQPHRLRARRHGRGL